MTCRSLPPITEEAIVEVARGRDVGRGTIAAVESHVENCEVCAARLARERRVSEGLRALAAATASAAPSAALESRLMAACAARRRWKSPLAHPTRIAFVAAAAAMVLAVVWWRWAATVPALPPPVSVSRSVTAPVPPQPTEVKPSVDGSAGGPPRGTRAPTRRAVMNDAPFIALPAAAGLPDFESGVIVRMELPQAALPAYGLEIVTGTKLPVEADLLIGQDGQARAIRLVNRSITRSGAEQ